MSTGYFGWYLFDAVIEHEGRSPGNQLHEEQVTTDDIISAASRYTKKYRSNRMCRCMVFATGGTMDLVNLSPETSDPGDILRVDDLFPNGAISIKLLEIPGKGEKLTYDHRVIVSNGKGDPPLNLAVKRAFNVEWMGNIVIVPYSIAGQRRKKMNSVPWGHASFQFLTLLLKHFLDHFTKIEDAVSTHPLLLSDDGRECEEPRASEETQYGNGNNNEHVDTCPDK